MSVFKRQFSNKQTYQWTTAGLNAIRQAMYELKFNEIVPAILSCELEPGAFHSIGVVGDTQRPEIEKIESNSIEKQVSVTGKATYFLPVSHNFEKQQAAEYLDKVYCLAPCIRLLQSDENISTKHLNTFFQIEVEWKTESIEEVLNVAENLLIKTARSLIDELLRLNIEISSIAKQNIESILKGNFPKITFAEALIKVNANPDRIKDLDAIESQLLCNQFDRPFWIYNYPLGVRDAVYHENNDGLFDTFDLMLPFGYGELSTGGIRPKTGEAILKQSCGNLGEPETTLTYGHAHWKKERKIQTAGFGIGFERFLRFISGSNTVLDFIQPHDHGPNQMIESTLPASVEVA